MPISAKDALEKANSLELKDNELKWFEKLCYHADYYISKNFDGGKVEIDFDGNMFLPDPMKSSYQINCGPGCHFLPHWRQGAVVKVWISTYEKIGWRVTPVGQHWNSYNSRYLFEIDKRDIKLNEILK